MLLLLFYFPSAPSAERRADEVAIPSEIWARLDRNTKPESFAYSTGVVVLKEKNSGVLKEPEIRISLARGGGKIDLAEYLGQVSGTFFLKFEMEEFKPFEKMDVFFVSKSRKRKVDGEEWGAGCGKIFSLKSFMTKVGLEKGIEVNTTRARHVSLLAGHFVFGWNDGKRMKITRVSFTDSSKSSLLCEDF
jgi:hypothetical protein